MIGCFMIMYLALSLTLIKTMIIIGHLKEL